MAGTLTVALAGVLIQYTSTRLLENDAEAAAVGYAHYVDEVTPGLRDLFEGRGLRSDTREQLARLRRMGEVFRFKLFDREGRQILVSDDLDHADPLGPSRATSLSQHRGNDRVAAIVLGGANFIETKSGRGKPDRPEVFVEAYVPVLQGRQVVGVVEVYVDQTATAARVRSAFLRVGAVVAGLLMLLGGVLAAQVWQRQAERRRAAERLRYLAEHDVLSGALNRTSFHQALQRAAWRHEKGGPGFAVLCIDLDRFKDVNDSLGHVAGDTVLCAATERLRGLLRHGDLVARLGGDEFAVLQSAVLGPDDVERLAARIVEALALPYEVGGQRVSAGASVGAARFGVDAGTVADLMHKADVAVYRAKSGGRGRFSFYDAGLDQRLADRRNLARDLRQALKDEVVSMHFQPLFRADGRTLLGYEALMRWHHPQRGAVPPTEFIALAEETGLIEGLGEWGLRRACKEAAGWPAPLTVSVNLSAAQFHGERDLVEVVAAALKATALPARRLVLEITESLLLSHTDDALRTLTALAKMGVQIAMDDFGTGYSSLAYLWRFPFDKIKIDRAFTQGLGDDERVALIVRSIITLAHSMGIRVNAEGVETGPQLEQLRRLGCDEIQGFLLGRPAPPERLSHDGTSHLALLQPPRPELEDIQTQSVPLDDVATEPMHLVCNAKTMPMPL
ncbi:MAG: bifunctional diguanylate cyclase/phosphodiesterase [Burkholderiales bacterium]|nr:bifunctional diguanylate cyclase/phosphodiesterase [Burkholderiales bacterium]